METHFGRSLTKYEKPRVLPLRISFFSLKKQKVSVWQINRSWPKIGLPKQCTLLPPVQWLKPGSRLPQRRSGGFSLTPCHATLSIIRLNFTQMLSVWFTQSAVHHCSALVCLTVGLYSKDRGWVVLARRQPKKRLPCRSTRQPVSLRSDVDGGKLLSCQPWQRNHRNCQQLECRVKYTSSMMMNKYLRANYKAVLPLRCWCCEAAWRRLSCGKRQLTHIDVAEHYDSCWQITQHQQEL